MIFENYVTADERLCVRCQRGGKMGIDRNQANGSRRYLDPEIVLIAPNLITYECISAIQKKVVRNVIDEDAGWWSFTTLIEEMPLELKDCESLTLRAFQMANILSHAIYDCYYLALAEEQHAVLVTADRKLYDRVKDSGYASLIAWVEDPPHLNT